MSSTKAESLARLLLTEIPQYDKKSFEDAWSRFAIYSTFKSEIDVARERFLQQYPGEEQVFYNALVRLARGDATRIGLDYPYLR